MSNTPRHELIERIRQLLEMPGVCASKPRAEILALCERLSDEQLQVIAATTRIRYQSLLRMARSSECTAEVNAAKRRLDELLQRYGIS
ncbi:hypothetical protein HY635_00100 [Candidatus Uhrbacteria bacterium]|nr:hypothetical protein [Candidatus Uhrbacteria bacterium]